MLEAQRIAALDRRRGSRGRKMVRDSQGFLVLSVDQRSYSFVPHQDQPELQGERLLSVVQTLKMAK